MDILKVFEINDIIFSFKILQRSTFLRAELFFFVLIFKCFY